MQIPHIIPTFLRDKHSCPFYFFYLGPHLQHMEVPKLEAESELQLPAYTTTIATLRSELHLRPTLQLMATWDP